MSAFPSTHWSTILILKEGDQCARESALERLAKRYWPPLYSFARASGHTSHDAEDLTQAFFVHALDSDLFCKASSDEGRLRSLLLAAMKHFLINDHVRRSAQKRGGHLEMISIEQGQVEQWFLEDESNQLTPDQMFDRHWARSIINEAEVQLKNEYREAGKIVIHDLLSPVLDGKDSAVSYDDVAEQLNCPQSSVRVLVHRMRERHHAIMMAMILDTVAAPDEVPKEAAYLAGLF